MLLVLLALPAHADPLTDASMTASWRITPDHATVEARVAAAVDSALSPYNAAIRALARSPLSMAATFCDRYVTVLTSTTFTITCDGKNSATARLDGTPTAIAAVANTTVEGARDATSVSLTFRATEGTQYVRYTPEADGTLSVQKSLHVSRLDCDVTWPMVYTRER